jgi:hypothetical protein
MFLESITLLENDVLIPINRIKYINTGYSAKSWFITITSDDGDWIEGFGDEENMRQRYKMLKKIINAK